MLETRCSQIAYVFVFVVVIVVVAAAVRRRLAQVVVGVDGGGGDGGTVTVGVGGKGAGADGGGADGGGHHRNITHLLWRTAPTRASDRVTSLPSHVGIAAERGAACGWWSTMMSGDINPLAL